MIKIFFFVLTSVFICYSCSSKKNYDNYIVSTKNVKVEYLNFEIEDSVTIIFNTKEISKSADDKYSMLINCYFDNDIPYYPLKVNLNQSDSKNCSGSFKIPPNSIFIRIFIAQNNKKLMEYAAFPVFSKDKPKPGSLYFLMDMARDLDQFERIYNLDKELEKYNYAREIPNVKSMLKGGTEIDAIKNYLDTIKSEYERNISNINNNDKAIYLSTFSYLYVQLEDYNKANQFLTEQLKLYETEKISMNLIIKSNIINTFQLIINLIKQEKQTNSDLNILIEKIILISKFNVSSDYLRGILLPCDSSFIKENKNKLYQIFDNAITMIRDLNPDKINLISGYPDIFWILAEKFQLAELMNYAEETLKKGIEFFEYSNKNFRSNGNYDLNFDNGILSSMLLKLGELNLSKCDTANAMILYKKIIETSEVNVYNRGPITFAAHRLTEINISNSNLLEARKYLYSTYTLGDPRLNLLISKYRNKFKRVDDELLKSIQSNKQTAVNSKPNIINSIETNKGKLILNDSNNNYYFLIFLNDECIACNLKLDSFIDDLLKNHKNSKIFLISDRKIKNLENYLNTNRIFNSNDSYLKMNFKNMNLFPFMVIIYNNKIIWELNSFPKTFDELLTIEH